jgi:four helix bundle protein
MIRAANSIHANVAEGFAKTPNDFKRFLAIAIGSCNELTSHIVDANRIGLINDDNKTQLLKEYDIVVKQLAKLKQNWH